MFLITFFSELFTWIAHPVETRVEEKDLIEGEAVFVTGKLMDPEFVREITGRYIPFTSAFAEGYARDERGSGKKKTLLLVPRPGAIVLGSLLLNLSKADLDALYSFEQVPEVRDKVPIRVITGTHERTATTFLPKEQ